jgi:hypothetical protein
MTGTIGGRPQATASKFKVIFHSPISLAVRGDIRRTFDFNLSGVFGATTDRAIILFSLEGGPVGLHITLNDLTLVKHFAEGPQRSVHEVIEPAVRDGANQLHLLLRSGSCTISDFVLWHQVRP